MVAEYLSYVKSIAKFALTFFGHIISVLASVTYMHSFSVYTKKEALEKWCLLH